MSRAAGAQDRATQAYVLRVDRAPFGDRLRAPRVLRYPTRAIGARK
jgi:hypothetical protein